MSTEVFSRIIICLLILTCFILFSVSIIFAITNCKIDTNQFEWQTYTVMPGDTFWNIMPNTDDYNIRYLIKITKARNHINDLIAYETIEIPII